MAQSPHFEFVENKGQWDKNVKFVGNIGGNGAFFMGRKGFTVLLHNPADMAKYMHHDGGATTAGGTAAARKIGPAEDTGIIRSHAYRVNFEGASDNIEVVPDKLQS